MSRDALRMRLKRICEKKKTGKMWISQEIHDEYVKGGTCGEQLELALLETIQALGENDKKPDKVRARALVKTRSIGSSKFPVS